MAGEAAAIDDADDGGGVNVPAIVGGSVAALVLLCVAAAALFLALRRRRHRAAAAEADKAPWPARGGKRRASDHKCTPTHGALEIYNTDGTGSPSPDQLRPQPVRSPTDLAVIDGRPAILEEAPDALLPPGALSTGLTSPPDVTRTHHGRTSDPQTELTTSAPSIAAFRLYSSSNASTPVEALEDALDALYATRQAFMGQYELFSSIERRSGGQGLVQFARSKDAAGEFAIKVRFWRRQ